MACCLMIVMSDVILHYMKLLQQKRQIKEDSNTVLVDISIFLLWLRVFSVLDDRRQHPTLPSQWKRLDDGLFTGWRGEKETCFMLLFFVALLTTIQSGRITSPIIFL